MATTHRAERLITCPAVVGTALDGTTTGFTYQPGDIGPTSAYLLDLNQDTDAVIITISGTGSNNNTIAFNIWGYGVDTPAESIYILATAILGTAVAGSSQLYVDTITGTDKHTSTVGIYDSGSNRVCKLKLDTQGLKYLYFEPTTFTTLTACKFHVREAGSI